MNAEMTSMRVPKIMSVVSCATLSGTGDPNDPQSTSRSTTSRVARIVPSTRPCRLDSSTVVGGASRLMNRPISGMP